MLKIDLTKVLVDGEELLSPESVRDVVSESIGAEFSLKQVSRLGDSGVVEPLLYKRRRWYRRSDIQRLLDKGHIRPSASDPSKGRLVRAERRNASKVPRTERLSSDERINISKPEIE